uniref:ANK_REP_REGION domain-containing protein n=1 Tax=Syphacia muris TaxID=451379 RepID=A0A158R570_9BILA
MSAKASDDSKKANSSRQSSVERYAFGYTSELLNQECSISQAKRLRERLQQQQSGQSGSLFTGHKNNGDSSECSSLVGTPTESGRSFTYNSQAQKVMKEERNASISQNISELMLDAIHFDDLFLVERTLAFYSTRQPQLTSSPSVGSTNTLTDLAQKRCHNPRRSNASSTLSIHSTGKSTCAVMNILHMAIAHKKYEIVQRLLEFGFDPNAPALCHCKGSCIATGNIPLVSINASRALSVTPELCTVCAQLRVVSIINQTPLAIAVRAQNAEIIALLIAYGADPNLPDDDGNIPLMIAVRECPSNINILYTLVFFGSQIEMKNVRGSSPLDLSPELQKVQARCVEDLFSKACCVGVKSENKDDSKRLGLFFGFDESLSSVWERAWLMLKKMALNPECLDVIRVMNILLFYIDAFDTHLGGLLHRMLQISIAEYQSATPTYREAKRLSLLDTLSSLAKFCFQYLQKEGASRQFSALNTLNKIIDVGLVHELFVFPETAFCSSKFVKKPSMYNNVFSEVVSLHDSNQQTDDQKSTTDHVFFYSSDKNYQEFTGQRQFKRRLDLINVFASAEPSQIMTFLYNALTMERREAGIVPICSPAHRWRQCWKHCTQVLIARLLLFLCHITSFRTGMSCEEQLAPLSKVLEPTLDPQLLCLILQALALIALDPSTHKLFVELDIDDKLVQFILPADDWYHTNHSTCYGPYVKYHAARILVYVGMGDRVSNRVSIFHFPDSNNDSNKCTSNQSEDEYICQTCSTPNTLTELNKNSISVEQVLLELLEELDKKLQYRGLSDTVNEEKSNALSPPARDDLKLNERVRIFAVFESLRNVTLSIVLENLREHLCKIAIVVDPMLILRLLLHKLTWDLSIVKKKVAVIDSLKVGISRIRYSASLGANIRLTYKDGPKAEENEHPRTSKHVKIRRTSSLELPETSRFTYFMRSKERRRRLGTDTSSSSKCSRKTEISVSRHFPKYIKTLFRKRTITDPYKCTTLQHCFGNSTSESEVLEFARKLQNYPMTRREALHNAFMHNSEQDPFFDKLRSTGNLLPGLEIQNASPPRSPMLSHTEKLDVNNLGTNLLVERRPSSPQAIPGLPLIEIRRPSAMSQIEYGTYLDFPELTCRKVSECSPLLQTNVAQSRKSSDESSVGGWSSRASSAMSQRSSRSSGGMRLSAWASKTSITSDNSGLFLFRFAVRKRASTVGTKIPLPLRAFSPLSRGIGNNLRVPGRESPLFPVISEMNPDFHCVRQLVIDLLELYSNKRPNIVSALEECAEVMKQILASPQHPKIKSWCNEIIQTVEFHIVSLNSFYIKRHHNNIGLKERILSGSLPCPKDQAAFLASIQLTVEKELAVPLRKNQETHQQLAKGQFGYTPDVRPRHVSLMGCVTDQQPMLPINVQKKILPVSLVNDRKTNRLIQERKRKLFHSRVYENEIGLKKLYIEVIDILSGKTLFQSDIILFKKQLKMKILHDQH